MRKMIAKVLRRKVFAIRGVRDLGSKPEGKVGDGAAKISQKFTFIISYFKLKLK